MASTAHSYEKYKSGYEQLLSTVAVRPSWKPTIDRVSKQIQANRARYLEVENAIGVPWQFVGVVHSLECGLSFSGHLHNGDSLLKKTWRVPKKRPDYAVPAGGYTWLESALDALKIKGLQSIKDWTDSRVAYELERYNGFGYRAKGKPNSPYLWSGSNHYTRGKYVADHKYDPGHVSQQTGAMLLYLRLKNDTPAVLTKPEVKELKETSKGFWITRQIRDFYRFLVPSGAGLAAMLEDVRNFFMSWQGMMAIGFLLVGTWAIFEYLDNRKRKDVAEGRHIPSGTVEEPEGVDPINTP